MGKSLKERFSKVNIFLLILLAFGVYIAFFGEHNYKDVMKLDSQIKELKAEIKSMQDSTALYEQKLEQLKTDPETFEKIIREQYQMKSPDEDLYIVKEK